MNALYVEMQDSLDAFNEDRAIYGSTLDENEVE